MLDQERGQEYEISIAISGPDIGQEQRHRTFTFRRPQAFQKFLRGLDGLNKEAKLVDD